MFYLSSFILVFNLLFLVILPHFLWIRWIIRAFRKRRVVGRVIALLSYLLFLMPWVLMIQGSQRSYGRVASAMLSEDAIVLGMWMGALLLPMGYFYGRWVYAAYRQKVWKTLYIRLSLLLLLPASVLCLNLSAELYYRSNISADLGVQLPYWGTNMTEYTENKSGFRGEGEVLATLEFDTAAFEEFKTQIRQTDFYDSSRLELYGSDSLGWIKSETLLYWRVREHLEATQLTGLWVYDPEKGAFEFYEPNLSDIPNSSILFKESYVVSAEVNLKNRTLTYIRWIF
jgi:hypothetical protein